MAKLVSKTYGDALFDLALEENTLDIVIEEVDAVKDAFQENVELMKLLNHPKISKEDKIDVIENVFKEKVSDTTVGFLVIIVDKGRYNDLNDIFDYFISKVKEYKNIGVASVTSAVALTDAQKEQVKDKLLTLTKYDKIEISFYEDQSLIGGMVIRIGDRVVDSSIKTQLATFAKDLSKIQLA